MVLSNNANDSILQNPTASNETKADTSKTTTSSIPTKLEEINTLDTSTTYALNISLQSKGETIEMAYSIANEAVAFTQYTSVALTQQYNILEDVKDRLTYITQNTTTDSQKEIFREDIASMLSTFDKIATDGNYNKLYYLQKSDTNTDASEAYNFQVSNFPATTLETESIQSNTTGLGLDTLKNLTQGQLTDEISSTGLTISQTALESINNFQSTYNELQKTFRSSVKTLNDEYVSLNSTNNTLQDIDYAKESANFSKSDILKQHGSFLTSQANTSQAMVSSLLI